MMEDNILHGKGLLHISIIQKSNHFLKIWINQAIDLDPTFQNSKVTVQILSGQQRTTLFTTKSKISGTSHEFAPLHEYNSEHHVDLFKDKLNRKRLLFNLFANYNVYDKTEELIGCFSLSFCSLTNPNGRYNSELVGGWYLLLPPYQGRTENVQVASLSSSKLTHRDINQLGGTDSHVSELETDTAKNIVEVCTQINRMFSRDAEALHTLKQKSPVIRGNNSQIYSAENIVLENSLNTSCPQIKPPNEVLTKNVLVASGEQVPTSQISETPLRIRRRSASFTTRRRVNQDNLDLKVRKLRFEHSSLPQLNCEINETCTDNNAHECFKKLEEMECVTVKSVEEDSQEVPKLEDLFVANINDGLGKTYYMYDSFKKQIHVVSRLMDMNDLHKTEITYQSKLHAEDESPSCKIDLRENNSNAASKKHCLLAQSRHCFITEGFLRSIKKQTLKLKALKYRLLECHHCEKTENEDEISADPEIRSQTDDDTIPQGVVDPVSDDFIGKTSFTDIDNMNNRDSYTNLRYKNNDIDNSYYLQSDVNDLDLQTDTKETTVFHQSDKGSEINQKRSLVDITQPRSSGKYHHVYVRRWVIGFFRDGRKQELGFSIKDTSYKSQTVDQCEFRTNDKHDNTPSTSFTPAHTLPTFRLEKGYRFSQPRDPGMFISQTRSTESWTRYDMTEFDKRVNSSLLIRGDQNNKTSVGIMSGNHCSFTNIGNKNMDKDRKMKSKTSRPGFQTLNECKRCEEVAETNVTSVCEHSTAMNGSNNESKVTHISQRQKGIAKCISSSKRLNSLTDEVCYSGCLMSSTDENITFPINSVASTLGHGRTESLGERPEGGCQKAQVRIPSYCQPFCIKSCCKRGRGDGSELPYKDNTTNLQRNQKMAASNLGQCSNMKTLYSKSCSSVLKRTDGDRVTSRQSRRLMKNHEGSSPERNGSNNHNVRISHVVPGTAADDWGLLPGDKLIAVNYKDTRRMNCQQMSQILRDADSDIMLEIERTSTVMVDTDFGLHNFDK